MANPSRKSVITRTVVTGFVAKAAMFLPTLAIARIVVPVLGAERFGVLMTILSLLAFLAVADLGVGGSLVTSISRALGAGDIPRVRQLQVNGFIAVSAMALALLLIVAGLSVLDFGAFIFPASPPEVRAEANRGLLAFGALFALGLPLTLVGKIQLGLQRGHIANYWQIATALVNFSLGVLAAEAGLGIPAIIAGMMSGTLICGVLNLVTHYYLDPAMRPQKGDISRGGVRELLGVSLFYLALQIIFVIAYAADTLLVARIRGAEAASVYALSERLFSIVGVAVAIITGPLWAAYGEALGAQDRRWAERVLRWSTLRIAFAAVALAGLILLGLQPLVALLSKGHLTVPVSLAVAMALWRVIEAVGQSLSVYMFASQAVRFVLIVGGTTAVVSLCLKAALVGPFGMPAVPAAMSVAYVLLCLVPTLYYVRRARAH